MPEFHNIYLLEEFLSQQHQEQNPHSAATKGSEVERAQLQAGNVRPALILTTSNALGKFLTALWIYGFTQITNDSNYSQDGYTDNLFSFLFHLWKQ